MAPSSLGELLHPFEPEDFLGRFYGKEHLLVPGWHGKFEGLLPWTELNRVLSQHRLDSPRLRLARDGNVLPTSSFLRHARGKRGARIPMLDVPGLLREIRDGATLVLDCVEEVHEPLTRLAERLEAHLREHIQINAYATWAGTNGFDLHYDDHDVVIVQLAGRKRWCVYGPTRRHAMKRDPVEAPRPSGSPLWEGDLSDGDALYMPRGCWHVAYGLSEPSLHLTIGIHKRTGADLIAWLGEKLLASPHLRQDLPRFEPAEERAEYMSRLHAQLLDLWSPDLLESYLRDCDARAGSRRKTSFPWGPAGSAPEDEALVRLAPARHGGLTGGPDEQTVELDALGKKWTFAASTRPLWELLLTGSPVSIGALATGELTSLEPDAVRQFVGELLSCGLLVVVDRLEE